MTQQQTAAKAGDDGEPRIRVRGLGKHYGALEVFKNINFDVGKREIVAIVGPSGAGKSTVARLAVGLYPPSSGEIRFEGQPLSSARAQPALRRFGIESTVRPSLAFYNTQEEIDELARVLRLLPRK